jgi:hypothetical protein
MKLLNINNIKFEAAINNKIYNSSINLNEKRTSSLLGGALDARFTFSDDIINVSIKNNGSTMVLLNNLKLDLFSTRYYNDASCIINPKNICEKINSVPMSKVKETDKVVSYLFDIFLDEENHNNTMFGFLGCNNSGNFIVNVIKKNEFKIIAVYNFINHELLPGEELILDSLFIREEHNIFSLFNNYVDRMLIGLETKEDYNKKLLLQKSDVYSILFTYKVNDSTLKVDKKPVYLKVGKKKLYAVDISTEEGKKKVYSNANAVLARANALDIDGIGDFIKVVEDNKLFNAYYELNKLLTIIKNHIEGVRFFSDSYPLGLLDENIIVENKELVLEEKKSLLDQISKKNNHQINYDFFLKLLMQRLVLLNNKNFSPKNKKTNELMSIVLGDYNVNSLKNSEHIEMVLDIDASYAIIPFVEKNKVFALLLTGKKNFYIIVFNFENKAVKFYYDLTTHSENKEIDGVATEVYSNTNYLISDGKLYIRSLASMDCCLFKKAIAAKDKAV